MVCLLQSGAVVTDKDEIWGDEYQQCDNHSGATVIGP